MAHIEVIQYDQSEGKLREIYDHLIRSRGKLAEVHKIQSLHPESITAHMDLYLKIMFSNSPLKRYQREMIAVIVSAANKCDYCINHHGEALNHFWKDQDRIDRLSSDYQTANLSQPDLVLCEWAIHITLHPHKSSEVGKLREAAFSDRAILDATLVVSYFNFVNRIVMGLGVELEEEGGKGYKYD